MIRTVFSLPIMPSRWLQYYLIIVHGVMLLTLLSLLGASWWSCITFVLLSVSFAYYYWQSCLTVTVMRDSDGNWYRHQSGAVQPLPALRGSVVIPQLVILYFAGDGFWRHTYSMTIVADSVPAELFRQLRLYCRNTKHFQ